MKISIVIPTIRSGCMINFQLPSLVRQQNFPKSEFEVIIVDDYVSLNGENRKLEIEEYGRLNGLNVKWVQSKKPYYRSNANIGCARNTGLIFAKGELVIFIDDWSAVRDGYLENVWNIYYNSKSRSFSHIGSVVSVGYQGELEIGHLNIDRLIVRHGDERDSEKNRKDKRITRLGHHLRRCPAEWFYTCNASAPLKDLIKVNGFWEIADLTREEDVLMGLMLERIGRKFCFVDNPGVCVYHMTHDGYIIENNMKRKYKEVSFKELGWDDIVIEENGKKRTIVGYGGRGRNGLNTNSDEVQRVTKDIWSTKYPGSWALVEVFKRDRKLRFNQEIGFDLKDERKKIGNWI